MNETTWLVAIGIWIMCAIGAYLIAGQRGDPSPLTWGLTGLLLGPIGLGMAATMSRPATAVAAPKRDTRTSGIVVVGLVVATLVAAAVVVAVALAMRPTS